jgi:hypothetical protein
LPQFNAASVVDALDFTFEPFVSVHGTIKEPNDDQINKFLNDYKALTKEVRDQIPQDIDASDPAAIMDAMGELDVEVMVSMNQKMAEVMADLCSGFPSREQILALPPRHRNIFYVWLQEQVMSPEAATGGGAQPASSRKR